jgi:DNA-binding Lrp family transcriptional regulator
VDKFKSTDIEIMRELLKNSRRSDRDLAKALGISQPTVTRRRANIERNLIDGYTAVPRLHKIGVEIVAFTFVKNNLEYAKSDVREKALRKVDEWMMKQPNVILAMHGQGMGWNGIIISFHKNYSDFMEFISKHNSDLSEFILDIQSFISNLSQSNTRKPFHLKYLANMI